MNGKYKVRFHLAKGENYQKFQITHPTGEKLYFDPLLNQITMYFGKLVNHQATAKKIHEGANKTVCSWIECDGIVIECLKSETHSGWSSKNGGDEAKYNPRINPNWMVNGKIADSKHYNLLYTNGKRVFVQ
jgi:hypothetical protein